MGGIRAARVLRVGPNQNVSPSVSPPLGGVANNDNQRLTELESELEQLKFNAEICAYCTIMRDELEQCEEDGRDMPPERKTVIFKSKVDSYIDVFKREHKAQRLRTEERQLKSQVNMLLFTSEPRLIPFVDCPHVRVVSSNDQIQQTEDDIVAWKKLNRLLESENVVACFESNKLNIYQKIAPLNEQISNLESEIAELFKRYPLLQGRLIGTDSASSEQSQAFFRQQIVVRESYDTEGHRIPQDDVELVEPHPLAQGGRVHSRANASTVDLIPIGVLVEPIQNRPSSQQLLRTASAGMLRRMELVRTNSRDHLRSVVEQARGAVRTQSRIARLPRTTSTGTLTRGLSRVGLATRLW